MNKNDRKGPFSHLKRLLPQGFSSFWKLTDLSLIKLNPAEKQRHWLYGHMATMVTWFDAPSTHGHLCELG